MKNKKDFIYKYSNLNYLKAHATVFDTHSLVAWITKTPFK
jgi:hypothetical protein